MVLVAIVLAVVGACLGYLAAWRLNTSAAGMIAVVLGIEYAIATVIAPDDGLVARLAGRMSLAWRVTCEDRLAEAWRAEEAKRPHAPAATLIESCGAWWLSRTGQIVRAADGPRLSPSGRREAETVVRSHRLWEAWLGRHAELPVDHLHPPAEWVEHHLGAAMRQRLEAETGGRDSDPHGREIPPEA
jgi:hypothetical protein